MAGSSNQSWSQAMRLPSDCRRHPTLIVDNILLWAASVRVLLEFFPIVLDVLQKYRVPPP
jgi:glycerol-3-phosphate O-acyltransferase